MRIQKRTRAMAAVLAVSVAGGCMLTGCGNDAGSGSSGRTENFTYLLSKGESSYFYDEYEENPVAKYWMDMEWDAEGDGNTAKVAIDFIAPPTGAETDNLTTLLSTGEYPDMFDLSYSSKKASELYEDGIALDLTEYVEKYMPNYRAWAESHPEYADRITNLVDGERRYLQIYDLKDIPEDAWGGYCYRRDWIVKYGTNPQTGAPFSGAWEGDEWVDDVVFPSGGSDPFYISDWEWMLDIFATALEEQGVTDGYPISIYYSGYLGTGDLTCGFGIGSGAWYIDQNGDAAFGGTDEGFRVYLECMNAWYEKGWLDKHFAERSGDMFYQIDTASVYSGKVGMWYGVLGNLGNSMDSASGDETDLMNGAVVFGAPQPINDIYGDDTHKNQTPYCYYASSVVGQSIVVTDKAKEKDLATLFTALDYLYSTEGGLLRTYGFTAEQQETLQDGFYTEWGLDNGAYTVSGTEEEPVYTLVEAVRYDTSGLENACKMMRTIGLSVYDGRDAGFSDTKQHSLDLWMHYDNTGAIGNEITAQLTTEETKSATSVQKNVDTYMSRTLPEFISGEKDIYDDTAWENYCKMIEKYEPGTYTQALQRVLKGE